MGQLKIKDDNDQWVAIPTGGVGVPDGGNDGDVLVKSGSADYATEWAIPRGITIPITINTNYSKNETWAEKCGSLVIVHIYVVGYGTLGKLVASGLPYPRDKITIFGNIGEMFINTDGTITIGSLATTASAYQGQTIAYFTDS